MNSQAYYKAIAFFRHIWWTCLHPLTKNSFILFRLSNQGCGLQCLMGWKMQYWQAIIMLTLISWVNKSSSLLLILVDPMTYINGIWMQWLSHVTSRKLTFFLMMTANPNWPEITHELLLEQAVNDQPDLVSWVFQLKKKALLNAILKDGIFGPCITHVYVIEFQKQGLPHMHLLIFLKGEYKLLTSEVIDTIISAKWPDPDTQPWLFEAVKSFIVHGPCGALNPKAIRVAQ